MPKITQTVVEQARPGGQQIPVWDSEIKGLGLRVTPAGAKSYIYQYRHGGQSRRITLGKVGSIEPSKARNIAKRYAALVAEGRDPKAEKDGAKARVLAEKQRQRQTFQTIAVEFIERYAKPKNRSWRKTEGILARHVMLTWSERPVHEIKKRDLLDLLDQVKERCGPGAANDVYAALRRFFNWCVEREIIAVSPLNGLRAPAEAKSRERTLSDKELAAVWDAAGKLGYPFGPFIQILILTAQRRTEVARMRWQQIDLDAGTWTLDGEDTKAKRKHVVPLSPQAINLLRSLPQRDGTGFVFTKTGTSPISGFSKAKARLDAISGVTGWELHDLRRTATTGLISLGVSEFLASRILNHASKTLLGVTAVYNRYGYLPEMRRALEAWAEHVTAAEEGETAKVVRLR